MAGRHRGESSVGKTVTLSRTTLNKLDESDLRRMCREEKRSRANAISVLVSEALAERRKALKEE